MKALEKAAQDRNKTPHQTAASVAGVGVAHGEKAALTLEPIETPAPASAGGSHQEAPRNTATPGAAGAPANRNNAPVRAAVPLSTLQQPTRGVGAVEWISVHPVPFTAALAGVFAIGYGVYIYLQAAHPALFLPKPPLQPATVAITAPATPAQPAQNTPSADTPLIPAQSVFNSSPDAPAPPTHPTPTTTATIAAPSNPVPASATGQIAAPAAPVAAPITPAPAARASPDRIVVSRGDSAAPRVNPAVNEAYAALESGRFEPAQRLYEQVLRSEPNNIDALLGLAAIAQQENRTDDASRIYLRILDVDPRHALAQTGLIALLGRADPQAAETRLKQLAARDPSSSLYFTLGNLYADQGQWSQAQRAYFQAHHLEAGNPDYAYNLAVALEHLGQQKLALSFYRVALQLAAGKGRSNFNLAQAQARISKLAARLE